MKRMTLCSPSPGSFESERTTCKNSEVTSAGGYMSGGMTELKDIFGDEGSLPCGCEFMCPDVMTQRAHNVTADSADTVLVGVGCHPC